MSSYQYFMVSRGGLAGRLKSGQQRATPELFRYQFDPGLVDKNPKRRARGVLFYQSTFPPSRAIRITADQGALRRHRV